MCLCVRAYAVVPTVFPTRLPLLFCFASFPFSPSLQETNTSSLCPLLDLPSGPGDQVGGQMLCRNARPSSEAGFLFHPIVEQKLLIVFFFFSFSFFLPWSQTSTWSSVLSSSYHLFSFVEPREMAAETWSLVTQPCQLWLEKLSAWPHM